MSQPDTVNSFHRGKKLFKKYNEKENLLLLLKQKLVAQIVQKDTRTHLKLCLIV